MKEYPAWYQGNGLIANGGQCDIKGARLKRPSVQEYPDLYVRVVERRGDGKELNKPYNNLEICDTMIVIDNVFIPWSRGGQAWSIVKLEIPVCVQVSLA